MELADYNIKFLHIKGKHNILTDAILRLQTLNTYKEPLENAKVQIVNNTQQVLMEVSATSMHTVGIGVLYNEQKWDKIWKTLVPQICHSNKNSSKSFTLSADGVLQKHQYIHGLQHDVTIARHSLVPTILHGFHDSKGHQGTICMFEVNRRSYWWPKLWQDIVKYIGKFSICTKHLPNLAKYSQQYLEVLKIPMAVLAMDTIGHFPVTSIDSRWALVAMCLHTSYIFAVPMEENLLKM